MYCGDKRLPTGKRKGTTGECFKKGVKTGIAVSYNTIIPKLLSKRTKQVEATTKSLTKKEILHSIHNEGLSALKKQLKLSQLNKDELRSIAVRLHRGPSEIPNYYNLSKQGLMDALLERGFQS